MKISLNWLKDFIPLELSPEKLADLLTMSGTEVENIEKSSNYFKNIIIVLLLDKLSEKRIKLFDGKSEFEIETNLPVEKGKKYAFSTDGYLLDEKELGLGNISKPIEVDSIFEPGTPLLKIPDWDDIIFDLEITPNRPDCLCHLGIARELSALLGVPINKPSFELEEIEEKIEDNFSVFVEDKEGCPRYTCRYIKDVKIKQSPLKIRLRLFFAGIRPINNAVDATNYVMLEIGQPLHAFDKNELKSDKIVVRKALPGDKMKALDEKEYVFTGDVVLITNGSVPVAIGGIIGGANSAISEKTKDIILESAYFNPALIRRASKKLEISTESSIRFERGVDPNNTAFACDRASYLIAKLCEGRVLKGIIDIKTGSFNPIFIRLKSATIQQVLGIKVDMTRAKKYLEGLGLKYISGSNRASLFEVPTFRQDLKNPVDLVEEIGRLNGYGRIRPNTRLSGFPPNRNSTDYFFIRKIAQILVGVGFYESLSNPFGSERDFSDFEKVENLVKLINPISLDFVFLRPSLVPTTLRIFSHNHRHKQLNCRMFEIANVYHYKGFDYEEFQNIVIGLSGLRHPFSWGWNKELVDIFDLKGVIEHIFNSLGIDDYEFLTPDNIPSYFKPGETIVIKRGNITGYLGRINDMVADKFELKSPTFIAEAQLEIFRTRQKPSFKEFKRTPSSRRDISVVVDKAIPAYNILREIRSISEIIVDVSLFDVFEGKQIPEGKRNLTFAIEYQSPYKTLTDDEINDLHNKVIETLRSRFKALIRGIDLT